ncbi:hypothetical protein [Aquimarina sp. I32.4]|uniref:hypothetical protein n=1 Tax=Aquimarina sp. I32.4 TaxID=2053903 RepID=UPI000CDE627C|nr:hypothetical protein [Aquimarina sp. I32.4]
MKFFKLIGVFIVINTVSCQSKIKQSMNWEIIDFSKIPGETFRDDFFEPITKYDFNQILPLNENHVILLGDNSGDRNEDYLSKESEAIVFISTDGGKNLEKHILGKGSLTEAIYIENTLFLVNETSKDGKFSSQLIKSDTSFKKKEVINEFKTEKLTGIRFFSSNIGVASFFHRDSINQELIVEDKYTLDGGKKWTKIINSNENGFTFSRFTSSEEIEYIESNKLIKFNFITGDKDTMIEEIAPQGYKCMGYYKDLKTTEYYTFIENINDKTDWSIKYFDTQEVIQIPKEIDNIEVYGNYLQAMVKDGAYYNYVWSENKGKTWHTEKLRDFFVTHRPIEYYGKGYVYAFVTCFKGKKSEKGGRFAIRKPAYNN